MFLKPGKPARTDTALNGDAYINIEHKPEILKYNLKSYRLIH
jgi:hypothetical protein